MDTSTQTPDGAIRTKLYPTNRTAPPDEARITCQSLLISEQRDILTIVLAVAQGEKTRASHENTIEAQLVMKKLKLKYWSQCKHLSLHNIIATLHDELLEFSSKYIWHAYSQLWTSNFRFLNENYFIPMFHLQIERIICVLGWEERHLRDEYEARCREAKIPCLVIVIDMASNFLPHFGTCFKFVGNHRTMLCCSDHARHRSLMISIAYSMMDMEVFDYEIAYDRVREAHDQTLLTQEHLDQLHQYQRELQLRYAGITPQRGRWIEPPSLCKRLTRPTLLPGKRNHERVSTRTCGDLNDVHSPSKLPKTVMTGPGSPSPRKAEEIHT